MNKKSINYDLKMRVKNYFKFVWKNGMLDQIEQEEQAISKLSTALQEEL
jgi:hypothetical protein